MVRPLKSEWERRSIWMGFRVSLAERRRIERAVDKYDLEMSEFIRSVVFKTLDAMGIK